MALALAQYEDLFQFVSGYLYVARGALTGMISASQEGALWFLGILLVTPWREVMLIDGETLAALTCQTNL